MKGKTPRIVMVVVALAMVASLIAGVTTGVSAEKPGVDERWTGFTLPSEVGYQLFPGTEVAHLELAADGTLIAAVYDQTFNRWGSPRGTVWGAVFVSTDGGYYWEFGWELPEDDPGQMVDLVAAPDYVHPGTVYLATQTYLYWSEDGCESFYRTYTACPGVSGNPDDGILGGVITSLDVAVDAIEQDEHVAVVGTSWGGLDGVYCWNIAGVPQWQDMEIGNRISAAFDTGPEGVLEVAFSPNYTDDRVIYAVANYDPCIIGPPWDITAPSDFTTVVTVYDGMSGTWGIQYMDAAIWTVYIAAFGIAIGAPASWARIAFFDDFDIDNNPYAVVALSGCPAVVANGFDLFGIPSGTVVGPSDDIWQTKHLPPAVGPSSATDMDLVVTGTGIVPLYYSVEAYGMRSLTGKVLVGVEFPPNSGQAQVFVGSSPAVFPQWEPAMKPPTGGPGLWWNAAGTWVPSTGTVISGTPYVWIPVLGLQLSPGGVDVESDSKNHYVGTGQNWGWSASGVSVGRENMAGKFVWNGVGLIDTIVVTTDVLSWTNYAAVTYEEISPHWANDGDDTLYISTWKYGFHDVFGMGTFNDSTQTINGYWMLARNAAGTVMGGFWGWYNEAGVFTPLNGVLTGTGNDSVMSGTFKACAGDPVGACCQGDWGVDITAGDPMSAVLGELGFDIAGSPLDIDCDPSIALEAKGYLYAHDYGVDVWRNAPTGMDGEIEWERIAYENLVFPLEPLPPFKMFDGLTSGTYNPPTLAWDREEPLVAEEWFNADGAMPVGLDSIVVPRVPPDFEFDADMDADEYVFLLGGVTVRTPAAPGVSLAMNTLGYQDNLYFSFDGGESAWYASVMPAGAYRNGVTTPPPSGPGMSDTGWTVVDTKTVIMGDVNGYVWKTENGGNSWTDGIDTATGVVTDLNVSPIYSEDEEAEGADQAVVVGLWNQAVSAGQVWLSQDGAEEQFVQVGKDIVDDLMGPVADEPYPSKMVTNFDLNWEDNDIIYAGASGFFAAYCCGCPSPASVMEKGDVGVYRADVDLGNPSDSIWELIYGVDQMMAEGLLPDAHPCSDRIWLFTDLEYQTPIGNGDDATVYIPFGILEWWPPYDLAGEPSLAVQGRMRFALGGALRTLDGTKERVEWIGWDVLTLGLPRNPHTGLWLIRPVEGTNYLFSIPCQFDMLFDEGGLADYDIGFVIYEDTLCEDGPELLSPTDGKKKVGDLAGELEKVNVILDWDAVISEATVTYEVQLDEDSKFNASERFVTATSAEDLGLVRQAVTTDTFAEFAELENEFTYFWRVRVVDPALSPWSETWEFVTKASSISTVVTAPSIADGSPAPGATNVPLRPTFSWSAIGGVDYYELEVATDSNFSNLVIEEETEGTAYQPDSDLDENTTYYWRVRGCTDDGECSDWSSTGVFTTGPEGQPGTPAWVWVVIVIGAILAIVVIVLIVRTRRPA